MTKKMARYRLLVCLLSLCSTCCLSCSHTSTTPNAHLGWTANAAQMQMVETEVTKPGFAIHLPSTYEEVPVALSANATPSTDEVHGYQWRGGTRHPNGAYPLLIVGIVTTHGTPEQRIDLHELIKERLAKDTQGIQNVVTSPIEDGSLNGVACARTYWKGTIVNARFPDGSGPLVHGFTYIAWNPDTNTLMAASGGDSDPYYSQTGKELEAAVLTLKPD